MLDMLLDGDEHHSWNRHHRQLKSYPFRMTHRLRPNLEFLRNSLLAFLLFIEAHGVFDMHQVSLALTKAQLSYLTLSQVVTLCPQ